MRELAPGAAAAGLAGVRAMWEMGAVLRFLALFRDALRTSQLISAGDLEEALVRDPGHEGLLAALHADLLHVVGTRSAALGTPNWAAALRGRFVAAGLAREVFRPPRGQEAAAYAALGARER